MDAQTETPNFWNTKQRDKQMLKQTQETIDIDGLEADMRQTETTNFSSRDYLQENGHLAIL